MRRRLIIGCIVLLLLAGLVTILWTALDWPPPRLILKYGFPPQGGPVLRVPPDRWSRLPEALRPAALPEEEE